jgi:hypothetical protein
MDPELHPDRYVFVSVPELASGLIPVATIREEEGLSAVVATGDAAAPGLVGTFPCAWITLRVHSALDAVGFLAAITRALAEAGIGTNPVAGAHHDHLFVPWDRRDDAMAVLRGLAAGA